MGRVRGGGKGKTKGTDVGRVTVDTLKKNERKKRGESLRYRAGRERENISSAPPRWKKKGEKRDLNCGGKMGEADWGAYGWVGGEKRRV